MIEGKAIRRMRSKCRIAIVGRGKEIKFNTRTLHQSREGMRHPKARERIEGQPPATRELPNGSRGGHPPEETVGHQHLGAADSGGRSARGAGKVGRVVL